MRNVIRILCLPVVLTCATAFATDTTVAPAGGTPPTQNTVGKNVDNSGMNARDKANTALPQNQTNAKSDRKLLAAVRRSVVHDKTLSTSAHNVKIMVAGAAVTLRGPVKNADEKAKIEAIVKQVEGVTSIDNQLDVKAN
jgi:hypothetical protein